MLKLFSRLAIFISLLAIHVSNIDARTLEIGPQREFADLNAAAAAAQPGDTIVFVTGVHAGGAHVSDLKGTADKWIVLRGDGDKGSIIRGGSNAFQLTDAAYLRIEGLVFEAQTGNGVNLDDGGTYDTPSHHIVIDTCEWRSINATGNNDMLKMSGIDDFVISNCSFSNGAAGGSMIDMVGCHRGEISMSVFTLAGSNCIQAKGATSDVVIHRNKFTAGGQRTINIGGSTGLEFFRPLGATYEARNINVWSNIIDGSVAAIAFVGAIDSKVINNTILDPERWVVRILQESVDGFQPCGNNSFINNIVITSATQPAINIGSNTAPETFIFSHNLWYNPILETWMGPSTPVEEPGRILNQQPRFEFGYFPASNSPAKGAGLSVQEPERDYFGQVFDNPRSIGALESFRLNVKPKADHAQVHVYPNPASSQVSIRLEDGRSQSVIITDLLGRTLWSGDGADEYSVNVTAWAAGLYRLVVGQRVFSFLKK